jgi:NTE family protein
MAQMLIEADGGRTLGLALGGGGARGLAHILVLEALDELGVKPALVAGTSIGAIIGAAYASGLTGQEIRWHCEELFGNRTGLMRRLVERWPGSIGEIWNPFATASINVETVLDIVMPERMAKDFESLAIPFIAVATDFHRQVEYEIASGPLRPAIAASAALPALLKPVVIDGRVLIDGGFVNPLPYEQLRGRADIALAIDVNGEPRGDGASIPNSLEQLFGMSQIVIRSILREKLRAHQPDILLSPPVGRFRVLDFFRFKDVLAASIGLKDEVKRSLHQRLEPPRRSLPPQEEEGA